jgi:hypothetical protein
MASDTTSTPGTALLRRHATSGPAAIGTIVPRIAKAAFRKHSPASALLAADWPLIVGPGLAATTSPRRLVSGVLTLGCSGPVALELQHLATALIERINQHTGRVTVERLRFVQEAIRPHKGAARPAPRAAPIPIEGVGKGALHDALSSLGAAIKSEPA